MLVTTHYARARRRTGVFSAASALFLACAALVAGCNGSVSSGSSHRTNANPDTGSTRGPAGLGLYEPGTCSGSTPTVNRAPVRRISRLEYDHAVFDLFGETSSPAEKFVAEEKVAGFNSNTVTPPTALNAEQYLGAAETLSKCVVEGGAGCTTASYTTLSGCSGPTDAACTETYLKNLTRRAYRGTASPDDQQRIVGLYRDGQSIDANAGLELALQALLVSPHFLFIMEFGTGSSSVVPLSQPEIASRLALALWRSVPDQPLLDAADAGELGTAAQVETQARRMLADGTRSASMLGDFVEQWIGIERLQNVSYAAADYHADWPNGIDWPTLRNAMEHETLDFFTRATQNNGTLGQVLTADFTFGLSNELATLYGATAVDGPNVAADDRRFSLPANRRGLLMQASVLAAESHPTRPSPVLRGKLLRSALFCDPPSPPPPGVNQAIPDAKDTVGTSTSDLIAAHAKNPTCANCHQLIDPLGAAFNHFDAIGGYQETDNGGAVTTSGNFNSLGALSGSFTDAQDMVQKVVAQQSVVGQCYALQGFRYALGRAEGAGDACAIQQVYQRFADQQFSLEEVIVAITGSDAFRYRTQVTPGQSCQ